jgi:3-hydroxymyristoyl/3-hydroxydecanoyl-(acyl carrier protein) dehydratase
VNAAVRPAFHLVGEVRRESPTAGRGEGWALAATVAIPAVSRLFAGHFPHHPLLPGIAHLALVEAVLAAAPAAAANASALGHRRAIVAVRNLRLRRPILPGDQVDLHITAGAGPSGSAGAGATGSGGRRGGSGNAASGGGAGLDSRDLRFEIRRRGDLASHGTVRIDVPEAAGTAAGAAGTAGAAGAESGSSSDPATAGEIACPAGDTDAAAAGRFPAPAELLPHAPPARLLTAVLAAGAARLAGVAAIPGDHPLVSGGEAPGFLALEIAAQAGAALQAILADVRGGPGAAAPERRGATAPRIGYLVGVRDAWLPRALSTGQPLAVVVTAAGGAAELAIYELQVEATVPTTAAGTPLAGGAGAAARPLARGTISTFLPAAG